MHAAPAVRRLAAQQPAARVLRYAGGLGGACAAAGRGRGWQRALAWPGAQCASRPERAPAEMLSVGRMCCSCRHDRRAAAHACSMWPLPCMRRGSSHGALCARADVDATGCWRSGVAVSQATWYNYAVTTVTAWRGIAIPSDHFVQTKCNYNPQCIRLFWGAQCPLSHGCVAMASTISVGAVALVALLHLYYMHREWVAQHGCMPLVQGVWSNMQL
jgi:hypothetical protein